MAWLGLNQSAGCVHRHSSLSQQQSHQRPVCARSPVYRLSIARIHPRPSFVPQVAAGGGAGSLGGSNSGGWGGGNGGGGGGSGGQGDSADQPKRGNGGFYWQGWADRVAADPEFPFKVLLEQVIGVGASVIGDMSSRPNWGLNELDFVFATLVVGSIVNFALMYLLAPTAAAAGGVASQSLLVRALSEEFLVKWGAPGGNMFQPGFPISKRLVNFVYKGTIFAVIGMMAGTVGTSLSNGLLHVRQQLDPTYISANEPPSVLGNAACWALHMGVSSNLRYQLLGGADSVLVRVMPMGLFRTYSAVIRGLNNIVGGMSFVTIARLFGVQKSGSAASKQGSLALQES
ncbi:hypothetical protein COO60DRAFT_1152802 [Scenedesmus sp. NREL 46B-D3]|nr:hypothetical protein COO60DRAFT_1152802 [Scenedesmus sp. NREL 46B-D3]